MSGLLKNILKPPFKHKRLSEDFTSLEPSTGDDGVSFACRELGTTFVTEAQEEATTADAIRRIVHAARVSNLKPRRVTLRISSSGIRVQCASSGEILMNTDIYNITYCSADAHYNHVFAFITTVEKNAFECHAYLCHSAKVARTISLSIAQAFTFLAQKYLNGSEILEEGSRINEAEKEVAGSSSLNVNPYGTKTDDEDPIVETLHSQDSSSEAETPIDILIRSMRSTSENLKSDEEKSCVGVNNYFKVKNSSIPNSLKKNLTTLHFLKSTPFQTMKFRKNACREQKLSFQDDFPSFHLSTTPNTRLFQSKGLSTFPTPKTDPQREEQKSSQRVFQSDFALPLSKAGQAISKNESRDVRGPKNWETFNTSSPVSSFRDSWNLFSTDTFVNSSEKWTRFSD